MRIWTDEVQESVQQKLEELFEGERFIVLVRDGKKGVHLLSNSETDVVIEVLFNMAESLQRSGK